MPHTPGPWRIRKFNGCAPDSLYDVETDKANEYHGEIVVSVHKVGAHSQANARLIAAAPELLAALQSLFALAVMPSNFTEQNRQDMLTTARAAIAKAKGERA